MEIGNERTGFLNCKTIINFPYSQYSLPNEALGLILLPHSKSSSYQHPVTCRDTLQNRLHTPISYGNGMDKFLFISELFIVISPK